MSAAILAFFPAVGTLHHQQQRMRVDPHADLTHYNTILMPLFMIPCGFMLVALSASSPRWLAVAGALMGLVMVGAGTVMLYRNRESWNRIYGRDSSPYYTSFLVRLPWPMTTGESLVYLGALLILLFGGWAMAIWISFALIEPSLWRLVPPLAWPFLFKFLLWRRLVPLFVPRDYGQRLANITDQR